MFTDKKKVKNIVKNLQALGINVEGGDSLESILDATDQAVEAQEGEGGDEGAEGGTEGESNVIEDDTTITEESEEGSTEESGTEGEQGDEGEGGDEGGNSGSEGGDQNANVSEKILARLDSIENTLKEGAEDTKKIKTQLNKNTTRLTATINALNKRSGKASTVAQGDDKDLDEDIHLRSESGERAKVDCSEDPAAKGLVGWMN